VEVLKQGQYVPQPLEDQVMIIFAGGNGYLDELDVAGVARFEIEFKDFVRKEYPDIPHAIRTARDLPKEVQEKLHSALKTFKEGWKA
jgi:F-type H+-transporting ATPase subunit alpha